MCDCVEVRPGDPSFRARHESSWRAVGSGRVRNEVSGEEVGTRHSISKGFVCPRRPSQLVVVVFMRRHEVLFFFLRNVRTEVARSFATSHDLKVHHCLCGIIGVDPADVNRGALQQSTLPFHFRRLGLAVRTSWAESVSSMHKKDPGFAATVLTGLNVEVEGCVAVVNQCADRLVALDVEFPNMGRSRRRRHA